MGPAEIATNILVRTLFSMGRVHMGVKVITNHVPRDVIDGWQLTPSERKRFDYLDWEAIDDGRESASFFRYRGELYDLGEFMRVPSVRPDTSWWLDAWDGYCADSFSSGTLVRYVRPGCESVIVASFYATSDNQGE